MSKGTIKTRAYKYNPSSCDSDWKNSWVPEEDYRGSYDLEYDETANLSVIAQKVAGLVADELVKNYELLKHDPKPLCIPVYGGTVGNGLVGAEVYYRGANSTMKISARMRV